MFQKCLSDEEAKKLFRRLCLLLHPDKGGSNDLMILLNESYELFLNPKKEKKTEKKPTSAKIFMGDDRLNIISEMYEILENFPQYNCDFFNSLMHFLNARKYLTEKQYEGLLNTLNRWKEWSDTED